MQVKSARPAMSSFSGKGNIRGKYIISKKGERDGADIWTRRRQGTSSSSIVNRAEFETGEFATERYYGAIPMNRPAGRSPLAYYEPWDW